MQKSVVFPVQELAALCENSAESFHLGQKEKKVHPQKCEIHLHFCLLKWFLQHIVDLSDGARN